MRVSASCRMLDRYGIFALGHALKKVILRGEAKDAAFHLTQIEIAAAAFTATFVIASCALLTLYIHRRQRRSATAVAHQFEQARAARVALAELSACGPSVADAGSALVRLQKLRVDNFISDHRKLRLTRSDIANNDHLYRSHQSLLGAFDATCVVARDHIAVLREVVPLAAVQRPTIFNPDVVRALVGAESSFDRILHDNSTLLEEADRLLASIRADFDNLPGLPGGPASP
jgi:hypothetical protein